MAVQNGNVKVPGLPAAFSPVRGRLLGVDALLLLEVDEDEHRRRSALGLTTALDRESLCLLSRLPHGDAVRVIDLTDLERRALRRIPHGVAELVGGRVTRLAIPPVTIRLVIVIDDVPDRGLDRASMFAAFAPRLLVLTEPSDDLANVEVEARFYGIGLAVGGPDGVAVVADPEPARRSVGPVTWRVREEAYEAFLASAAACT
jgi:hypothetical protein